MWPTFNVSPLFLNRDNRAVVCELKNKVLNVTAPYQQQKPAIQHHTLQGQHGNIWYHSSTLGQSCEPRQGYKETLDWLRNEP